MTEVSFNVTIMDDNILESNETFQLSINSSSLPNRVTVDNPSVVTVTIVDNDRKLLILFNLCDCLCKTDHVYTKTEINFIALHSRTIYAQSPLSNVSRSAFLEGILPTLWHL